jgi:DNA-binding FadR family transcriptional regulator
MPDPDSEIQRPKKTATLLAQRLISEITDNGLEPGSPLPSERSMLDQYGVARGSMREALRYLEIQGVIQIKTGPGGGPIVSRTEPRHLANVLAMQLQLEDTSFREVLEVRAVLEPILARRAAQNATEEGLGALKESIERMRELMDRGGAFLSENGVFHRALAEMAGNQVFALINSSMLWISDRTRLAVEFPSGYRERVCDEHERIFSAIADRDPDRAAAAMSLHVADFVAFLEENYPAVVDARVRWDQIA